MILGAYRVNHAARPATQVKLTCQMKIWREEWHMSAGNRTYNDALRIHACTGLLLLAVPALVIAQEHPEPDVIGRDGLIEPPTLEERIVEEREVAEQAAAEVLSDEEVFETGVDAPLDEPNEPQTHASAEAPPELVALAAREPERFIGKMLVLDDGVNATKVGPVLALRKRIADQEAYVVVDASDYFNSPTQYAVSVRDLDRIEGDLLVTPEVEGMHLRGLEYYPEDYTDISDTSPEAVLAGKEDDADDADTDEAEEEQGVIPIRRF